MLAYLLECLCVSQRQVLPILTHWLELCSCIHSLQKYSLSACNMSGIYLGTGGTTVNETSKTPCLHGPSKSEGTICEMCDWCYSRSCPSLLESGQSSLFSPTQRTIYLVSQCIVIERQLHTRALAKLKGIWRTQTDSSIYNKHKASHSDSLCIIF